ncbi:hypothetical protein ACSIGC_08185 [Tenacibaculum sp. ZS6-P6]|uniref:hypothetical protein n=1 Tax=Tenacibaculum sp. ZS6-P6 TaxID=3447503 RepID=UPI003F98EA47
MTSQDCPHIEIHGINNLQKWNKIMNAKKQLATLSLIALGAFGTLKAQTSNDNLLAFNGAAKTEVTTNNNAPIIKVGHGGDAETLSIKNSALVLYISGGTKDKYSAEQYAKMLQTMFKDAKRTNYPTDISIVYQESQKDRVTLGSAYINGRTYDKNGGDYKDGDGILTPAQMVKLIPVLTAEHAKKNNIAAVKKPEADSPSIVMN